MRIFQVTDPHVPPLDAVGEADHQVRQNFLRLMSHVADEQPDLLVLTGDLPGKDGSREVYEYIRRHLPVDVPVLILPGNHDDPVALFDVFEGGLNTRSDFVERMRLDAIDLLFLNTASTRLPDEQLALLQDDSLRPSLRPGSLLFLHHPTQEVSGGWMDQTYPLQNAAAVHRALNESSIQHVFCGHFHAEKVLQGDYTLYVTPSPAFTVDLEADKPVIGPPDIPYREITVDGDRVETKVVKLDPR